SSTGFSSSVATGFSGLPSVSTGVPLPRLQPFALPPRTAEAGALLRLIEAFAVDAHGGGKHDALDRMVDQAFEEHRRAQIVHAHIAGNFVHGLAHANFRRKMDDEISPL